MYVFTMLCCVLQSTYKYFKYYKYIKYMSWYLSVSTNTMVTFKQYLSTCQVQVLKNMCLSVLKYKYQCTWPSALHTTCCILYMLVFLYYHVYYICSVNQEIGTKQSIVSILL